MKAPRPLGLLLVPLLALAAARGADDPVPIGGAAGTARLVFEIVERGGGALPARLTFVPPEGGTPLLFPDTAAAPRELAVRDNVVYSRTGRGCLGVPPGRFTVFASHGPEWSLASQDIELRAGEETVLRLELVHELDTSGWIGGDFHLHTLTHSGHGDANLEERVLSFLGEGLEFAVATDHNHQTDYRPTLRALGVEGALTAVTGNEVSTPLGHLNAFPLEPEGTPVDPEQHDAHELFRLLRAQTNPFGVVPVIQLNHPRLEGIDFLTRTGLDPVTGLSQDPAWAEDFDALEVLNENLALGYHDPAEGVDTHGHRHSVLADWFHLLNRGLRPAALGNSDSHHVRAIVAGYPRNYVRSSSDDPAAIRPAEVAAAVRAKQVFTTTGPFLEYTLEGAPMGGEARARDGHARLALRVRAASWVACDHAEVFVNGDLVASLPIEPTREVLRLEHELELCLLGTCARHGHARPAAPGAFDAWVTVIVEGDRSLAPILAEAARPLAIGNPVWIDGDGDGRWTSPSERIALELRAQATPILAREWFATLTPAEQALAVIQAPRGPFAAVLVEEGFGSNEREVLLAAVRAAERNAIAGPLPGVLRLWNENRGDPFLDALLLRVIGAGRPEDLPASLLGYQHRYGPAGLRQQSSEILPLFRGGALTEWRVLGPFPCAEAREPGPWPPASGEAVARGARSFAWQALSALPGESAIDLTRLAPGATDGTVVLAECFLRAPKAGPIHCAFGSDDGGRLWCNGRLLYENPAKKGLDPLETMLTIELAAGWNRLVVEVENGTGGFGFSLLRLEPGIEAAAAPR